MKQLELDQLNLGAIKMKELTTAIIFIGLAHLFCVPYAGEIQEVNAPLVAEEEIEPEVKTKGTVELQLADWCSPCRKFKAAGIIEELEGLGWEIKYVSDIGNRYPAFRLVIDDKKVSWTGYSSKSSFYKTLKNKMKQLGYPEDGRTDN
jgi:thiol-disulfide isomerase/thioredoxin